MASHYYLSLALLMVPLLLILHSKIKSSRKQNYRLPPGPWTLPIIGSIHHLIGRGIPHHALHDLSQRYGTGAGGLMFLQLGEHPTVIVSSSEAAKEIYKTHDLQFCDRPVNTALKHTDFATKDIAFTPYGALWREMRKVAILGSLTSRRVQSFRSIHEEEISGMMKHISSTSVSCTDQYLTLSLRDILLGSLTDIALRSVLGSKSEEKKLIVSRVLNALDVISAFKIPNMFPSLRFLSVLTGIAHRVAELQNCTKQFVVDIMEEHRKKEGYDHGDADDMISVLLRLYDDEGSSENNGFTKDNVVAVIFDVIVASILAPSTILEWAMTELMKNPRVMQITQTKIRQQLQGRKNITESDLTNLNIVQLIIKETMRLHSGLLLPRECRETCNILGYDIPKGTTVLVNTHSLGMNSNYWKDPEEFKPERFLEADVNVESDGGDFKFFPFGAGRKVCPGALLGSAIMELVLANLLYHFDWELPHGMSPDELDMTEEIATGTRKKSPLYLRALPYQC